VQKTGALYVSQHAISFVFDPVSLPGGRLPTYVGIVVTDVLVNSNMTFQAFRGAAALGNPVTALQRAEGKGFTAQDRFYGWADPGGIERVVFTALSTSDWALDHLQYGRQAPRCGDGTVDGGEQCDDDTGCCSATCQLNPAGSACVEDGNLCTADICT